MVSRTNVSVTSLTTVPSGLEPIDVSKLDFSRGLECVNRTERFALPVPQLPDGGELLVFPDGTPKAGEPMKTMPDGSPARGVVFFNCKDQAWQAVRGDGSGVIIINEVTAGQAQAIHERMVAKGYLTTPSIEGVREILEFSRDVLSLVDFFNSNVDSVKKNLRLMDESNPYYYQVSKDVKHRALYVPQSFTIDGPVQQHYPKGAVVLNDGPNTWGIDTGVFMRNFKEIRAGIEVPIRELPPAI